MTCYFRHIKHVFEKAEIEITNANKQEVDRIIHGIVGVKYSNCPDTSRSEKENSRKRGRLGIQAQRRMEKTRIVLRVHNKKRIEITRLLFRFRLHFLHRFTTTYQVTHGTTAWIINHHDKTAFITLVFGTFLGHTIPPP